MSEIHETNGTHLRKSRIHIHQFNIFLYPPRDQLFMSDYLYIRLEIKSMVKETNFSKFGFEKLKHRTSNRRAMFILRT